MDTQSRLILEKLFKTKSINPKNQSKTLIGNDWPNLDNYILSLIDEYSFGVFKKMSGSDIGRWGEMMFEEQFGIKSDPTGLDIKELKADIKTLTRAEKRTKFTGGASESDNPDWYFLYLIFPHEYRLYKVPSSDKCIRVMPSSPEKGSIDITEKDLQRFDLNGYRITEFNKEVKPMGVEKWI